MLTRLADTYYTYKFLRLLTMKWEDIPAVKAGILDNSGEKLREPKSEDERAVYTPFVRLVIKLKQLIEKVPFGKTSITKYATALWLIKEETGVDVEYSFKDFYNLDIEYPPNNSSNILSEDMNKYIKIFGILFEKVSESELSLVEDMSTAGIEMSDNTFGGHKVFDCDTDTILRCRLGKTPYVRYSSFVGSDDTGKAIRDYSVANPKKSVVLRDKNTGAMLYLRKK